MKKKEEEIVLDTVTCYVSNPIPPLPNPMVYIWWPNVLSRQNRVPKSCERRETFKGSKYGIFLLE